MEIWVEYQRFVYCLTSLTKNCSPTALFRAILCAFISLFGCSHSLAHDHFIYSSATAERLVELAWLSNGGGDGNLLYRPHSPDAHSCILHASARVVRIIMHSARIASAGSVRMPVLIDMTSPPPPFALPRQSPIYQFFHQFYSPLSSLFTRLSSRIAPHSTLIDSCLSFYSPLLIFAFIFIFSFSPFSSLRMAIVLVRKFR